MEIENDSILHVLIVWIIVLLLILSIIGLLLGSVFGVAALYSKYQVWSYGLSGEAELRKAEWNRQIAVREAQAKKDSAILLAEAEIERAKGVAQANKIIGDSLKGNDAYLRYLWIDSLDKTKGQIVYIPTEANLPILEARRK